MIYCTLEEQKIKSFVGRWRRVLEVAALCLASLSKARLFQVGSHSPLPMSDKLSQHDKQASSVAGFLWESETNWMASSF